MNSSLHSQGGQIDELAAFETSRYQPPTHEEKTARALGFILDHTAFVRGIGNIKRWFNVDYVMENMNWSTNESTSIDLYIPTYTFHEFDIVKRGTSIAAINARESISFVDRYYENEATVDGFSVSKADKTLSLQLQIEAGEFGSPSWNECSRYSRYTPKVEEFPQYNFTLDYNLVGRKSLALQSDDLYKRRGSETERTGGYYEDIDEYDVGMDDSTTHAIIPSKLKYLIRSCIGVIKHESSRTQSRRGWRLITEDPVTKIWCESFGITCMNVTEAESLILQNLDINQIATYDPNSTFSLEDTKNPIKEHVFFNDIDTTKYPYEDLKRTSGRKKGKPQVRVASKPKPQQKHRSKPKPKASSKPQPDSNAHTSVSPVPAQDTETSDAIGAKPNTKTGFKTNSKIPSYPVKNATTEQKSSKNTKNKPQVRKTKKDPKRPAKTQTDQGSEPEKTLDNVVTDSRSDFDGSFVKKEKFNAINFAPRGKGELWKP